MKKILIGFIAIGLLTFVGCDKEDDTETETTDSTETSSDDGSTDSDTGSDDDVSTDTSTDCDDVTTETSSDDIADSDGNTYKTVIIGEQEWFAENLRTTKYSDGTTIPNITDDTEWYNDTIGAWCHYDNYSDYECTYGKLYNWYAVEIGKLCPTGWHVPTDAEWTVLTDYLASDGHSGTEGTALKATSGWDYDGNGTDDYGWNGHPGGYRRGSGSFDWIGGYGSWWSSSQNSTETPWLRQLYYSYDHVDRSYNTGTSGFSVRCIKD